MQLASSPEVTCENCGNLISLLGALVAGNIVPLDVGLPGDSDCDSECILANFV